ncbi:lipopolysaccharide heptosyltransferase II, partial [mine drainage metagenome]
QHILVIMPTWLGDAVMATPFLRALRNLYPVARITCLAKALVQPVLAGLPLIDAATSYATNKHGSINVSQTAAELRKQNFDLAVILPNTFRSALLAWRSGIPRRLGYNRDGRRMLLTDYINPVRREECEVRLMIQRRAARESIATGRWPNVGAAVANPNEIPGWYVKLMGWNSFQPLPTIEYYLALSRYLGSRDTNRQMVLGITEDEREEAAAAMAQAGLPAESP